MTADIIDGVQFLEPAGHTLAPLQVTELAKGVHCLHNWFQNWGPDQWRLAAHNYKHAEAFNARQGYKGQTTPPTQYTLKWARDRIDTALGTVKKGMVLAAFPSFSPYNKNAALLREKGFTLLGGLCYPNVNYPMGGQYSTLGKGNIYSPDGYGHWIHIWAKDLKGLTACGEATFGRTPPADPNSVPWAPPLVSGFPGCCGLRLRWTAAELAKDAFNPNSDPNRSLAVCQIPATQKFPKGWKRFARYEDFKWGVNFGHPSVKGVQKCPHEYDLAKIEAWELAQPLPKLAPY